MRFENNSAFYLENKKLTYSITVFAATLNKNSSISLSSALYSLLNALAAFIMILYNSFMNKTDLIACPFLHSILHSFLCNLDKPIRHPHFTDLVCGKTKCAELFHWVFPSLFELFAKVKFKCNDWHNRWREEISSWRQPGMPAYSDIKALNSHPCSLGPDHVLDSICLYNSEGRVRTHNNKYCSNKIIVLQ